MSSSLPLSTFANRVYSQIEVVNPGGVKVNFAAVRPFANSPLRSQISISVRWASALPILNNLSWVPAASSKLFPEPQIEADKPYPTIALS